MRGLANECSLCIWTNDQLSKHEFAKAKQARNNSCDVARSSNLRAVVFFELYICLSVFRRLLAACLRRLFGKYPVLLPMGRMAFVRDVEKTNS